MTTQDRWRRAITQARAAGAIVQTNVKVCCHGCTTREDLDMTEEQQESTPYAYFLSTQGRRVRFVGTARPGNLNRGVRGEPTDETRDVCYFAHGNGGGQILADAFRAEGFDVDWDGTERKSVGVVLRIKVPA